VRKHYAACVSYSDKHVGELIAKLKETGADKNTIVILWGDHGWHLGDHGLWCKHTNFERAAHAPLIFRAPGVGQPGTKCSALAEFVDIYPTLCALCGLAMPDGLEGTSLAPLFKAPARPWKKGAFSQYPRSVPEAGRVMGYSVRTERYRLTEWAAPGKDFRALELYDYVKDPNETTNLANDPEHAATVKELTELLHGGWRAALPQAGP